MSASTVGISARFAIASSCISRSRSGGNSFNEGASSHRRPQGSGLCGKCFGVMRLHQEFAVGGMGFRERFAPHQSRAADVRFGSKADIAAFPVNVRFTPQKRTSELTRGMSALCQKRTLRVPKTAYSAMPILDMARRPLSRLGLSDLRQDPTVRNR